MVARIEAALHPELVAMLMRSPWEAFYRSIASAPAGMAPPALRVDSKLMSLIRVLGKPVQISLSESGWLLRQLPQNETDFLRESRLDLIVPVDVSPERTEAVLVLGTKRSERGRMLFLGDHACGSKECRKKIKAVTSVML